MRIGPYEVLEELARGSQGRVYQARDSRTGKIVALKQLHAAGQRAVRRFETEVGALVRLRHPNLVQVYEWGKSPTGPWFSQELIEGKSLQRKLRRWGAVEVREAVRIMVALAEGLEHAHQAGVLHRDVKPDNVILRPDGSPVLVDFGLARDLQSDVTRVSNTGEFLGSPGFWAPEQATGEREKIGPTTDVYGLGATLYALLSGNPPIEAPTLVAYLDQGRFGSITPLPDVNSDVPAAVWATCARCLEVEPEARFPSAAAVAEALAGFAGELPEPRAGRGILLAGLAAGALLACAGAALWISRPSEASAPANVGALERLPVDAPRLARLLAQSKVAFQAKDYEGTHALLDAAERIAPAESEVWSKRGALFVAEGRLPESRAAFERALELDPRSFNALKNLGVLGLLIRDANLAHDAFSRALELEPANVEILEGVGVALSDLGRMEEAEQALNRALALNPSYQKVWASRGRIRLRRGDFVGAYDDFCEAIELEPDTFPLWLWRARAQLERGQFQGAVDDATRALALRRDSVEAPLLRARARLRLEDYPGAERDLGVVLRRQPDKAKAWRLRGRLEIMRKDWEEARKSLDTALRLEPENQAALLNRGFAQLRLGNFEAARRDTERLLQLQPDHGQALVNMGGILIALEEPAQAVQVLDRALALEPAPLRAWENRASAYMQLGEFTRAIEDLDRALLIAPESPRALALLGHAHFLAGDPVEGERLLERALALQPNHPTALRNLAVVASTRGDHARALELIERCMAQAATVFASHWLTLAEVSLAAGKPAQAKDACQRALQLKPTRKDRARLEAALEACREAAPEPPMDERNPKR